VPFSWFFFWASKRRTILLNIVHLRGIQIIILKKAAERMKI
jgi:hypothetical protein